MGKSNSLIDAAKAAGEFGAFLSIVRAAGMEATLRGAAYHTIFAPTDEAFAKFPKATLDKLSAPEHAELLKSVVCGHLVAGQLYSARLKGKRISGKSIDGGELVIVGGGKTTVNGAVLVRPDILAANGVLHGIDKVLWPKAAESAVEAVARV